MLRLELGDLQAAGFDLALTGFDQDELDRLLVVERDLDADPDEPAPRILALAPVVFFAAVTQVKIQRAPVFLVFPDMLIDALVTDKGDAILRQTPADLIRTSLLLRQFFFDQLHQIWRHFARLVRGLFASLRGLLVGEVRELATRERGLYEKVQQSTSARRAK